MSSESIPPSVDRWNLRLWPGVVLVLLAAFCMLVPSRIAPLSMFHFIAFAGGPSILATLAVIWWTAFARTSRPERVWVPLLFVLPGLAVAALEFASREAPMLAAVFGPAFVLALWVLWLVVSRPLEKRFRLTGLGVFLVCGWASVAALRVEGTDSDMFPRLVSRFASRAEDIAAQELISRELKTPKQTLAQTTQANLDWAEFRGANRDGILTGIQIDSDWGQNPPRPLWKDDQRPDGRQKIGPGWGTFAAVGDRLFTQEQRGDSEAVVCYDATTGNEIWRHFEKAKHSDSNAQAGPRATPTVVDGKVYAQGATGLLVCLNAEDGKKIWATDIKNSTGGVIPTWGYSTSPLVLGGKVVVYTGGPDGKGTSAFQATDGTLAWSAGKAMHSYSSAHRTTISGVEQVLMLSDYGLESFDPATGQVLWEFPWTIRGMNRVTQPTIIAEGEFLIGTGVGGNQGTKRLKVTKTASGWAVTEMWFSTVVFPYFNDGVIHDGHFYGFASKSLVCVSLMDGTLKWGAGTKYGHGQVLLLKDSGLLVVLAMDGKAYLVRADPTDHVEEAQFPVLVGKTWNHPVINRGRLYVRNGEWAAAFELKLK